MQGRGRRHNARGSSRGRRKRQKFDRSSMLLCVVSMGPRANCDHSGIGTASLSAAAMVGPNRQAGRGARIIITKSRDETSHKERETGHCGLIAIRYYRGCAVLLLSRTQRQVQCSIESIMRH